MLDIVNKVVYKAFGLTLQSEVPLPELSLQSEEQEDATDIMIKKEDLSELWHELSSPSKKFVVSEKLVMFDVPDIAIFAIRDGNEITVSPREGYDEEIIRLYILGTCMGALLMQRRVFPLHGSAVAIDGRAYAFIGDSGAGKSTLASAFLNLGYQLVSDDVIAISLSQIDETPFVMPAYPQQKLWQDSLNKFGMETSKYRSIYGRETKYCVPVTSKYFVQPLPLAGVFELVKSEKKIEINRLQGLERLKILHYHTYRNFLIPRLGLTEWHFNTSAILVKHINVYRLRRPTSEFSVHQLTSLILDTLGMEGKYE